jgi:Gram-negative bacterial TonB protein C-terminal
MDFFSPLVDKGRVFLGIRSAGLAAVLAVFAVAQVLVVEEMRGQGAVGLADRLRQATELTSLDAEGSKPWHLKLEVQTFDKDGKPAESGTVEEWWASATLNRVVYTSAAGTVTEIHTGDGYFRTAGSSGGARLFELMREQAVHPISSDFGSPEIKPEQRTESFGKMKLDCVMLAQAIRGVEFVPYGLFPMYCLEQGGNSLRLSYDFGTLAVTRNRVGKFGEKMVPLELSANENGKVIATAKTVALQTMPLTTADFVPGDDLKKFGDKPAKVSSAVIAGFKTGGPDPIFPAAAKEKHVSGAVVMRAIIGRDGRIHKLTLISYGDGVLAMSSLNAVRQWTYKPYILNGEPTEVDTTITVNYNYQ